MSNIGVDVLKDALGDDESGLKLLFEKWSHGGDFTYELKWARGDVMLIVVTDQGAQEIEVYKLEISRLI